MHIDQDSPCLEFEHHIRKTWQDLEGKFHCWVVISYWLHQPEDR